MRKILLDTTYFMPAIGVSVKNIPEDAVIRLSRGGEEKLAISDMSIFELSAKGAKYVATGKIPIERVSDGIRAIIHDERVTRIPAYDDEQKVLNIAIELRRMLLKDFIDCLIVSSALTHCDALITEDSWVHGLRTNKAYKVLVETINPKFMVRNLSEVLTPRK